MVLERWDGKSQRHAAALLHAAAEELPGRTCWSIAELKLTDADFEKLLRWAREAHGDSIGQQLGSNGARREVLPEPAAGVVCPVAAIAGLVVLACFAECIARSGGIDAPWSAIYDMLEDCSLRRHLFVEGRKDATPELRDALLRTASEFNLRHANDDERDVQRCRRLLMLQSGLPFGCVGQLGLWLDSPESQPVLVAPLYLSSESFKSAWNSLLDLRAGRITRDRARLRVIVCPFFRSPVDEVLAAALDRRGATPISRSDLAPLLDCDAVDATLKLDWPRGQPPAALLTTVLAADADLGDRVVILVDGKLLVSYRRNNGALTHLGSNTLRSSLAWQWEVTTHATVESDPVSVLLFEEGANIACFDAHGDRCEADARAVRYVVAQEPIAASPPQRTTWLPDAGLAVAEVEPETVVRTNDGFQLWPTGAMPAELDPRIRAIKVEDVEVIIGTADNVVIRLSHDAEVCIASAFIGQHTFTVVRTGAAGLTHLEGHVPASHATPEVRLTLKASVGGRRYQQTVRFRAFTAASIDGAWLKADASVEAGRLRGGSLRVTLGPEFEGQDARLVVGDATTHVKLDAPWPRRVRALGYGERLLVCADEPWVEKSPHQQLALRVEERGEVESHEWVDGQVMVSLRAPLEPSADHWLLVWPRAGAPIARRLSEGAGTATDTVSSGDGIAESPRAVALCFEDAVLGASWAADWSDSLEHATVDAATLVHLIRMLSLPVLASPHYENVVGRLRSPELAAATFAALQPCDDAVVELETEGHRTLRPSSDTDRWTYVARSLLVQLRLPSATEADSLKTLVTKANELAHPRPPVPQGVAVSPELMAEQNAWAREHGRAFEHALLLAGVAHPIDTARNTRIDDVRARLSRSLADASMGISVGDMNECNKTKMRRRHLDDRRRRHPEVDRFVPALCKQTLEWCNGTERPSEHLRHALVDARMHARLQLELLHERAFPGE